MHTKIPLGDIAITRVAEFENNRRKLELMFPSFDAGAIESHRHWLEPQYLNDRGQMLMNIQAYVIRTRHHTILVDSCVGSDKERPTIPDYHRIKSPWLENLAAAGLRPEDIDFVLCTHLHFDHVGWNTKLVDGRWVPTFPKAKYLFARTEWEYVKSEIAAGRTAWGEYEDSILPIVEAGRSVVVEGDHALDDEIWLEPTPGHTPGHVCIHAKSGTKEAILTGDLMHHPVQCAVPEWSSSACADPLKAATTRRNFLERNSDSGRLILTAHFAAPSGGEIAPAGGGFRYK